MVTFGDVQTRKSLAVIATARGKLALAKQIQRGGKLSPRQEELLGVSQQEIENDPEVRRQIQQQAENLKERAGDIERFAEERRQIMGTSTEQQRLMAGPITEGPLPPEIAKGAIQEAFERGREAAVEKGRPLTAKEARDISREIEIGLVQRQTGAPLVEVRKQVQVEETIREASLIPSTEVQPLVGKTVTTEQFIQQQEKILGAQIEKLRELPKDTRLQDPVTGQALTTTQFIQKLEQEKREFAERSRGELTPEQLTIKGTITPQGGFQPIQTLEEARAERFETRGKQFKQLLPERRGGLAETILGLTPIGLGLRVSQVGPEKAAAEVIPEIAPFVQEESIKDFIPATFRIVSDVTGIRFTVSPTEQPIEFARRIALVPGMEVTRREPLVEFARPLDIRGVEEQLDIIERAKNRAVGRLVSEPLESGQIQLSALESLPSQVSLGRGFSLLSLGGLGTPTGALAGGLGAVFGIAAVKDFITGTPRQREEIISSGIAFGAGAISPALRVVRRPQIATDQAGRELQWRPNPTDADPIVFAAQRTIDKKEGGVRFFRTQDIIVPGEAAGRRIAIRIQALQGVVERPSANIPTATRGQSVIKIIQPKQRIGKIKFQKVEDIQLTGETPTGQITGDVAQTIAEQTGFAVAGEIQGSITQAVAKEAGARFITPTRQIPRPPEMAQLETVIGRVISRSPPTDFFAQQVRTKILGGQLAERRRLVRLVGREADQLTSFIGFLVPESGPLAGIRVPFRGFETPTVIEGGPTSFRPTRVSPKPGAREDIEQLVKDAFAHVDATVGALRVERPRIGDGAPARVAPRGEALSPQEAVARFMAGVLGRRPPSPMRDVRVSPKGRQPSLLPSEKAGELPTAETFLAAVDRQAAGVQSRTGLPQRPIKADETQELIRRVSSIVDVVAQPRRGIRVKGIRERIKEGLPRVEPRDVTEVVGRGTRGILATQGGTGQRLRDQVGVIGRARQREILRPLQEPITSPFDAVTQLQGPISTPRQGTRQAPQAGPVPSLVPSFPSPPIPPFGFQTPRPTKITKRGPPALIPLFGLPIDLGQIVGAPPGKIISRKTPVEDFTRFLVG